MANKTAAWRNRIVGEGLVAAGELVPHPQNWRGHPASQGTVLAQTLGGVGWVQRVIVNQRTGRMLDGHLRAELARRQGADTPVPVVYVDLSEDEERTILATLDPIAGMAIANEETLAGLVRSIEDADLRSVAGTIAQTLNVDVDGKGEAGKDTPAQVDRAEELRQKWQVEPGQLWQLGEHRLICGDCTDAAVVARVMGGDESIDMLATDPPFAITGSATGAEDMSGINIIQPFYRLWLANFAERLNLFGHAYICCDFRTYSMIDSVAQQHLALKNCIVWYKGDGGLGSMYQNCHELVWFGVRQERRRIKANKTGQRTVNGQPNVWRYTPPTFHGGENAPLHTANKPLEMFVRMIVNSSDPGDLVGDPFSGSGTTLIACEQLGRRCRAVEIAPGYVAVALERFHQHSGKLPVLLNE